MSKKAVLITGGAKRVGAALAHYFAQQGYDVALHYNRSKTEAAKLQKQIEKMGRACVLFSCDLSKTKTIPALMASVKKQMPHCSVLVNNASIFERMEFPKTDEALFDRQMDVNLKAPFFLTQAFAKTFGKGVVVNLLDTDIVQTHGSHFAYLLSKKALATFTPMAARALGPKIRVNAVCPGPMPITPEDIRYIARVKSQWPLRNASNINEVAQAVYWLSHQPSVTGQLLFVDGGKHVL